MRREEDLRNAIHPQKEYAIRLPVRHFLTSLKIRDTFETARGGGKSVPKLRDMREMEGYEKDTSPQTKK